MEKKEVNLDLLFSFCLMICEELASVKCLMSDQEAEDLYGELRLLEIKLREDVYEEKFFQFV